MVVAARKDIVSDHISTLRKAGLEPTAIGVIPFALQAAVKKYGQRAAGRDRLPARHRRRVHRHDLHEGRTARPGPDDHDRRQRHHRGDDDRDHHRGRPARARRVRRREPEAQVRYPFGGQCGAAAFGHHGQASGHAAAPGARTVRGRDQPVDRLLSPRVRRDEDRPPAAVRRHRRHEGSPRVHPDQPGHHRPSCSTPSRDSACTARARPATRNTATGW